MVSRLHVDGRYLKDENGNVVILRGVFKHGWEDHPYSHWVDANGDIHYNTWDEKIVADNLDAMKLWGANCVRAHSCAQFWIENTLNHRQILKDFIRMANERGMYVILTFYSVRPGTEQVRIPYPPYSLPGDETVIASEDDFINMWLSIADELKDYPNVLFEPWSESYGDEEAKNSWFNVYQRLRQLIPQDRILIYHWGVDLWCNMNYPPPNNPYFGLQLWADDPRLQGDNVVFSAHIYGDFTYTEEAYRKASSYDEVKLAFEYVGIPWFYNTVKKPLLVGEIGCRDPTDPAMLEQYSNELKILNEYDTNWVAFWWWVTGPHRLLEAAPNFQPNTAGRIVQESIPVEYITPFMKSFPEGRYVITMPSTVTAGGVTYKFLNWENGSTSPTRTIDLLQDVEVVASYVPAPTPKPPVTGILALWKFPICSRFPNLPPCPIILEWARKKGLI